MISIRIEVDTPEEARRALRDLLNGGSGQIVSSQVELVDAAGAQSADQTKVTRGRKAKPAEPAADEGNAASAKQTADASDDAAASPTATSTGATPPRDEIAKKAMAYGQPGKGGPVALKQLLAEHGAPNSKWSEVPDDQLPALNTRLDDLLAA